MIEFAKSIVNLSFEREIALLIYTQIRESLVWINGYNSVAKNKISVKTIDALKLLETEFQLKLFEE